MPDVELGVNDVSRMGLEVVGRHDILPVPTEQWIRYEDIEFHSIVDKKEFEKNDHIIKFRPPDACYLEIMRFRVRPPKARELPMQARCMFIITGQKVEIRADMMIPYPHTKAWGQVPCEDVAMRIPLPECWIYQFRTEKAHISFSSLGISQIIIRMNFYWLMVIIIALLQLLVILHFHPGWDLSNQLIEEQEKYSSIDLVWLWII